MNANDNAIPVRLCCGQRHIGPVCQDGKVMCCLCFTRVDQSELSLNKEGIKQDVCATCALIEKTMNTPSPTGIEKQVCDDIAKRQALGIAKYGQTVAENPLSLKQWLQHAYEEMLDGAIYLRRAIAEIEKREDDGK